VIPLQGNRIAGTSVDDRAGCAVLLALAAARKAKTGPTLHLVWSVQEEYNLRGVLPAATALQPDIALQIDLLLACDTPDMTTRGDVTLGGGPGISLYSFHGRGTLNGVIPHPALVQLAEAAAETGKLPLQRSAHTGALTDLSYIQFMGPDGVACLDVGFPMRYSHSALEVVDTADLDGLTRLLDLMLDGISPALKLTRVP
jgi:putative aminopeptidase FrvX